MKPLILLLVGSICGGGMGLLHASLWTISPSEIVGKKLDAAQQEEILKSQEIAEKLAQSGITSTDALPQVEVVGGTDFDFGNMKRGTSRSHEFIFKNTGLAPLKLAVKNSTCKCTVGSVTEDYIAPGAQAPVKLTWTAEGILPEFGQTATITTTDLRMREVKLTITGRIGDNYVLDPGFITLGEFSSNESVERKFQLFSYENKPLEVVGYWGDPDLKLVHVEHEIRKIELGSIPAHKDAFYVADFTLTIDPNMTAGPINGQVRLTVGPDEYPMSVQTTGRCVSDLRIVAGNNYDEEKNLLAMGNFTSKDGGNLSFFVSALNNGKDVTLEVGDISPAEVVDAVNIVVGTPIVSARKTLFPITINIPPGTAPIDRDGSSPTNFAQVDFKSNIKNSSEITMFFKFKVE